MTRRLPALLWIAVRSSVVLPGREEPAGLLEEGALVLVARVLRPLHKPAKPVSLSGVGNYTSYGVRTMVSDDFLYLGMANPMNLLTDPSDDVPEGGWELIKLSIANPDDDNDD